MTTMRPKHWIRLTVGLCVWAILAASGIAVWAKTSTTSFTPAAQLDAYFLQKQFRVTLRFADTIWAKKGDVVRYPVPVLGGDDLVKFQPIGEVVDVLRGDRSTDVVVWIYPHARVFLTPRTQFVAHSGPTDFEQVLKTLLDQNAKDRVSRLWNEFLRENQDDIQAQLKPLAEDALADYLKMIGPDLERAMNARQGEVTALLKKHYEATIKAKLLPVVEKAGMPLVEARILPVAREFAERLVDKAPKGWFVWNLFRDKIVPWDSKTNLQESFESWWNTQGLQIFNEFKPRMMAEVEATANGVLTNPEVAEVAKQSLNLVLNDPALMAIAQAVLQEAIVNNPKTGEFFKTRWESTAVQQAMHEIGNSITPYINRIIDTVLLDGDTRKINPNLVKVLRSQILWKDDFWILAEPGTEPAANGGVVFDGFVYSGSSVR